MYNRESPQSSGLLAWVHRFMGELPLERVPLDEYPDAIWLEVRNPSENEEHSHFMGGFDYYWADPSTGYYGCFNGPENLGWYEGPQELTWLWTADQHTEVGPMEPTPGATVVGTVMVPDDIARELGLI